MLQSKYSLNSQRGTYMQFQDKQSTQESNFESVVQCLQSRRLKYHVNKKDPQILEFTLLINELSTVCHVLMRITDMEIQLFAFLPSQVSAERFSDVVNQLLLINNKLSFGNFCVDLQTGEVSYRFCLPCWRVTPSPQEIAFLLDIVSMILERYSVHFI